MSRATTCAVRTCPIGVASGTASDSFSQTKHFRKMAIYVKDGRIIRVMERVEITGKGAGTILVKVTTSGRPVRIDGFAASPV